MKIYKIGGSRKPGKGSLKAKFAAAAVAVAVIGGGGFGIARATSSYYHEDTIVATVNDKAVKNDNNSSTYMIYTSEGVFTNEDSLVKGKWDSSDVYNALKEGCTYQFNVHGWRNHFFSMYENIDKAVFVPTESCPSAPKI